MGETTKMTAYETECSYARRIAACDTPAEAASLIAEAVLASGEHQVWMVASELHIRFENGFGPTCGVDDILELMVLTDWRTVCKNVVDTMLSRAGMGQRMLYPDKYPRVTLYPENDSPVISAVEMALPLPGHTVDGVRQAMEQESQRA